MIDQPLLIHTLIFTGLVVTGAVNLKIESMVLLGTPSVSHPRLSQLTTADEKFSKSGGINNGPLQPYAKAIIAAVAIPDPSYRRPIPDIRGEVSQLIDPPSGCRFQTRCKQVMDVCRRVEPPLEEVKPGHYVACHLYY